MVFFRKTPEEKISGLSIRVVSEEEEPRSFILRHEDYGIEIEFPMNTPPEKIIEFINTLEKVKPPSTKKVRRLRLTFL